MKETTSWPNIRLKNVRLHAHEETSLRLKDDNEEKLKQKNIGATACRAWARAETFNGLQKVLQILFVPGPTTL